MTHLGTAQSGKCIYQFQICKRTFHLPSANISNFELSREQAKYFNNLFGIYYVCQKQYVHNHIYTLYICIYIYLSCLQLNFNSHHLQHQQKSRKTNSNVFGYLSYFWVSCVGEDVLRLAFGSARLFPIPIHISDRANLCICICA